MEFINNFNIGTSLLRLISYYRVEKWPLPKSFK